MTTEEKARAYDEAFERAKIEKEKSRNLGLLEFIDENFPELKESEDERIRKDIISYLKSSTAISPKTWIAWLEKQGGNKGKISVTEKLYEHIRNICACIDDAMSCESLKDAKNYITQANYDAQSAFDMITKQGEQNSADKIEPKFHEGDWCVDIEDGLCFIITKVENNTYKVVYTTGDEYCYTCQTVERDSKLWTIQDAKDGDVLEFGDHGRLVVGIVSHINKSTGKVDVYCLLEANNFKAGIYYALDTIKPHPATKEQCDIFFAKMKEAGYEWSDKDRKLIKIVK